MEEKLRQRLKSWMAVHINQRFGNPTAWGKRAGISSSTIARVYETGTVSPKVLADLARSVGEDPLRMLVDYEFIRESDIASAKGLTREQRRALAVLEELPAGAQRTAFLEGLPGYAASVRALDEIGLLQNPRGVESRQE